MLRALLSFVTRSEEVERQQIQTRFGRDHHWVNKDQTERLHRPLLIAGLGNPGLWSTPTRHNFGYIALDALAAKYGVELEFDSKYCAFFGTCTVQERAALLVKPNTFMNRSGVALSRLLLEHPLFTSQEPDLLILVDDVSISLGGLRLRAQGSSGGHNGLSSIEFCLDSRHYARLRLGIGRPPRGRLSTHVLGAFTLEEQQTVKRMCGQAIRAAEVYAKSQVEKAMSVVNDPSFQRVGTASAD